MTVPGCANPLLMYGDAGVYQIERSLRFNSSDSAFLSRAVPTAGNRKTWTWSGWVKRTVKNTSTDQMLFAGGATSSDTGFLALDFNSSDKLRLSSAATNFLITTAVYRDAAAWMHIVLAFDAIQGTNANKVKLYVNGTEVTAFDTDGRSSIANQDYGINQAAVHEIGRATLGSNKYFDGYLADIHFIDGQALTPSSFTEVSATTGQLIPKAYTGSFGTNGFQLKFADNSNNTATTLGKDTSGNSNNWTPNNLSVTAGAGNDSLVDTPTSYGTDTGAGGGVRGNYCTWNPLDKNASVNTANGNLDASASAGVNGNIRGTIGVSSGKWYWEYLINNTSLAVGIAAAAATLADFPGIDASGYSYTSGGQKWNSNSGSSYGATYTTSDIVGVALDLDAGTLVFYKNGVSQGTAYSGLPVRTYFPAGGRFGGTFDVTLNAGQRAFAYTAPSGFKALCDTNLPSPLIAKPNTVMDVVLYTGTGSALTPTSSLAFNPDWIWIKSRSAATDHALYDVVRGATIDLVSNSTAAETTQTQGLTAFNSNGFSVGTLAKVNTSSATYAAWCWDAGTSTVTNTQGSITSQVRANASAGFSVVTAGAGGYFGGTVGHGLGVAPGMIILKDRNGTTGWRIYHSSLGNNFYLDFTTAAAVNYGTSLWGVTSSVFGSNVGLTNTAVAYCFAPVTGYSSFGSYTGNGSTDGPFVYTGFRPRWVMIKATEASTGNENWMIKDALRPAYNPTDGNLYANQSFAEDSTSTVFIDLVSNGFKIRGTYAGVNTNAVTYIYAAFAENPFQYARAR